MSDLDKFKELGDRIEKSPAALKATYIILKIIGVCLVLMGCAACADVPVVGVIIVGLGVLLWFYPKLREKYKKDSSSLQFGMHKQFEFPSTDGHGRHILTVYDMSVTGVMREHDGVNPQTIIPNLKQYDQIVLEADANNQYDAHAVKVKTVNGIQIGWLPMGENLQIDISDRLLKGQVVYARVNRLYELTGYPGNVGLIIDVARYATRK